MNWKKPSNVNRKTPLVVIIGPTGIGKTNLSLLLAQEFSGEIVNADSMQVYKLMDIGTAKPSRKERKLVLHHLIDIAYPDEVYNAARYRNDAQEAVKDISDRRKPVFVVGGTGLYIKVLTRGIFYSPANDEDIRQSLRNKIEKRGLDYLYAELKQIDPKAAKKIHRHDKVRIIRALEVFQLTGKPISVYQSEHGFKESKYNTLKIGLELNRDRLYERIALRAHKMLEAGLIDEVKGLLEAGYSENLKAMQALGYRHVIRYLNNQYSFAEMLHTMIRDTRRYAKRQLTWFRGDPEIKWYTPSDTAGIFSQVKLFLEKHDLAV